MPPIWRRLLVPADLTLAQLHDVLQAAMGWQDCHMHEFSSGHWHFGKPNPEDRLMGVPPVENERTIRLSGVLGRAGAKATYTYDMGDSWEHGIVLEKRLSADPGTAYPVCAGGERTCPPEDCGGIGGFYSMASTAIRSGTLGGRWRILANQHGSEYGAPSYGSASLSLSARKATLRF